jgi:FixJ family two-component response regulator
MDRLPCFDQRRKIGWNLAISLQEVPELLPPVAGINSLLGCRSLEPDVPDQLAQSRERSFPSSRRLLLVDDEVSVLTEMRLWLEGAGWTVTCARSADEALNVARTFLFAAAVLDYRLHSRDEGIRLGRILRRDFGVPFLLISGYLDTSVVVDAMKSGALDVVDKPLTRNRFLAVLEQAISGDRMVDLEPRSNQSERVHAELAVVTARWARMVLGACDSPDDPRTVPLWGHVIGASAGTIEATCRLCEVKAHDARDLGRVLRALSRSRYGTIPCRCHFNIADDRTLRHLFERAGLRWDATTVPLRTFLLRQQFVEVSRPCLHELAHLAANSQFFEE